MTVILTDRPTDRPTDRRTDRVIGKLYFPIYTILYCKANIWSGLQFDQFECRRRHEMSRLLLQQMVLVVLFDTLSKPIICKKKEFENILYKIKKYYELCFVLKEVMLNRLKFDNRLQNNK